jgi:hypothetical protein
MPDDLPGQTTRSGLSVPGRRMNREPSVHREAETTDNLQGEVVVSTLVTGAGVSSHKQSKVKVHTSSNTATATAMVIVQVAGTGQQESTRAPGASQGDLPFAWGPSAGWLSLKLVSINARSTPNLWFRRLILRSSRYPLYHHRMLAKLSFPSPQFTFPSL